MGTQLTFDELMVHHGFKGKPAARPKAPEETRAPVPSFALEASVAPPPGPAVAPRPPAERKVDAFSESRHRTTPTQKRAGMGSTATIFHVWYVDDRAGTGARVTGYGPTPGERRTDAIRKFRAGATDKAREHARSMERYGRPPGGGTFEPWR